MATIYDVAKKAGVGVGTVSRVINGSPHVSPRTGSGCWGRPLQSWTTSPMQWLEPLPPTVPIPSES